MNTIVAPFEVEKIREEFPILKEFINGKPLIYFDNGATTQKPKVVIDRISSYYNQENANVHRGVHYLSDKATTAYEDARITVKNFINASQSEEIIFTKGTTDGINTLAFSIGEILKPGDEILISTMEHHSNIVPWQMVCERKGCVLKVAPITESGDIDFDAFKGLLNPKTKLVSIAHISNTLGTINPVQEIIEASHKLGIWVLLDAAQSIQHTFLDVQKLDCDFLVFSGHKVFGPTGIGVLYGKKELLDLLPPYQGGGDMIEKVTFEKTTYNEVPLKFEAGTPNISGALGLSEALHFLNDMDRKGAFEHESILCNYLLQSLRCIPSIKIIGNSEERCSTVSFIIDSLHPLDIGTLLDKQGIAVRTGHHCTQPLMQFYNITGTVRVSLSFYNTLDEIDSFILALNRSIKLLS